jgi:hypothetical protein
VFAVGHVSVDFTRSDGGAPDVDLAPGVAAQVDPAVAGIVSTGLGVSSSLRRSRRWEHHAAEFLFRRVGPVADQDEVAEFLVGPEVGVWRSLWPSWSTPVLAASVQRDRITFQPRRDRCERRKPRRRRRFRRV